MTAVAVLNKGTWLLGKRAFTFLYLGLSIWHSADIAHLTSLWKP